MKTEEKFKRIEAKNEIILDRIALAKKLLKEVKDLIEKRSVDIINKKLIKQGYKLNESFDDKFLSKVGVIKTRYNKI
mgnify:CR=1 FL=1